MPPQARLAFDSTNSAQLTVKAPLEGQLCIGQDMATTSSVQYSHHNQIWISWTTQGTITTANSTAYTLSAMGAEAWTNWVVLSNNITSARITYPTQPAQMTPDEVRLRDERIAEDQRRYQAQKEAQKAAEIKADQLLGEFLDAMQKDRYAKVKSFIVESESGRRYELKHGKRVAELDEKGQTVALYCIHPTGYFPEPDVLLSQKLMLETDEREFLRIANRTPVLRG